MGNGNGNGTPTRTRVRGRGRTTPGMRGVYETWQRTGGEAARRPARAKGLTEQERTTSKTRRNKKCKGGAGILSAAGQGDDIRRGGAEAMREMRQDVCDLRLRSELPHVASKEADDRGRWAVRRITGGIRIDIQIQKEFKLMVENNDISTEAVFNTTSYVREATRDGGRRTGGGRQSCVGIPRHRTPVAARERRAWHKCMRTWRTSVGETSTKKEESRKPWGVGSSHSAATESGEPQADEHDDEWREYETSSMHRLAPTHLAMAAMMAAPTPEPSLASTSLTLSALSAPMS